MASYQSTQPVIGGSLRRRPRCGRLASMAGERVIRDPLYDYVVVPGELDRVVDHPLFQRLRRVRQTSLAIAVYPSATGTRFEHALGAMHLAQAAFDSAWRRAESDVRVHFVDAVRALDLDVATREAELLRQLQVAVGATALLHDVGHPPFSHALEPAIETELYAFGGPDVHEVLEERKDLQTHEVVGLLLAGYRTRQGVVRLGPLLSEVPAKHAAIARLAAAILSADESDESCLSALHSIVAGPYDVDRLDYLARDNHRIGTEFGRVDHRRLVGSFEIHEVSEGRFIIAPGLRARSAVETLLTQRVQSYRWVIFHSRIVGSNTALARALEISLAMSKADRGYPASLVTAIDAVRPNINYLNARDEDVRRSAGGVEIPTSRSEGVEQLFQSAASEANARLRVLAQAEVDDDTITTFLKQAAQIAEALLVSEVFAADLQRELRRLIAYIRSALFREKRFIAVWKTNDEYIDVANDTADALLAAVREGSKEVGGTDAQGSLAAVESEFAKGAVEGLNHIVRAIASERSELWHLERQINATSSTVLDQGPGWWTLTYAPLRAIGSSLTLFDGSNEVDLLTRSPFVGALRSVDAAATSLFAHFFLEGQSYSLWEGSRILDARKELQATFAAVFPSFARMMWPLYLRNQEEVHG